MSVGSIEPTAVPNGYRWMPYGATGGLAAYNGHLLVCKQTGAAYGGFLSTWVNGKGEVVSL